MTYQPAWKDINDGNPNGPPGPTTPLLSSSGNSSSAVSFRESQDRGTRFSFSVFNLMNAIMGSGILGLAYAVSECGIAPFIFLLIVVVLATIYSVNLLLEMCNMTGVMAYEDIGFVALKNPGKVLTAAIIMTQNIGSMSSYLFIIKTELPEVIETLSGQDGRTDLWYHDGTALVLMAMAFVILPLSCLPKIGFLSYTSSFSVISMTFFMIVVVVEKFRLPCPIPQPELTTTAEPYYTEATQGWVSIKASSHDNSTCQPKYVTISVDTAYAIPTMTFSFVCHTAVIPIYKELSSPTKARMLGVSVTALLACFVLYFTTGIFGYLTFYENVNSELLLSYSQYPSPIPIISVVRLIVLIAIIFHLPVVHFPCRISLMMLMQMILPRRAPSRAYMIGIHVTSTLILLSTITLIALLVPDIRVIFGLFGATSSVCLMLFLPSLFYILIAPGALYSPRKIIPCVMFVSSFLILGVSLTTIIYGFVHPKK